jgi:hypothetical protein
MPKLVVPLKPRDCSPTNLIIVTLSEMLRSPRSPKVKIGPRIFVETLSLPKAPESSQQNSLFLVRFDRLPSEA